MDLALAPAYQAIFNCTPTPLLVVAPPDWVIVAANDARIRATGKSREDTVGQRLFEAFPDDPDDPTADGVRRLSESLQKVIATRTADAMPVQRYAVRDESGNFVQRWWSPVNTPVLDEDGEVSLVIHQVEEVTEFSRIKLLLESLPGAAYRCEVKAPWRMLYMSEGVRFVSSYPCEQFIRGQILWGDLIHPDDRPQIETELDEALRNREHFNLYYRVEDPVRGTRWISEAGQGVYTPAGEVKSLVGFLIDVTEHENVQERLRETQAELIHLSRNSAMTAMAATLAHELNQPLAAAANYLAGTQRLLAGDGERLTAEHGLGEVGRSLHRAGEIIRRLRKMTEKGSEAQNETFDLAESVREAIKLVSGSGFDDAEIIVRASSGILVLGDRIQIEQVLVNLIKNAVEASRLSDEKQVTITVTEEDGGAKAAIEDSGPGVSVEIAQVLFQTFASTKENGMGIGLSISRTIIEAHRGKIWLEEAPSGGARFCFTLPAAATDNKLGA